MGFFDKINDGFTLTSSSRSTYCECCIFSSESIREVCLLENFSVCYRLGISVGEIVNEMCQNVSSVAQPESQIIFLLWNKTTFSNVTVLTHFLSQNLPKHATQKTIK